ncbi:MAG: hypothetical protein GY713_18050 [Actinomycetia bacterium]|nr:hypothetical protein [Actinomycetes bacterium]
MRFRGEAARKRLIGLSQPIVIDLRDRLPAAAHKDVQHPPVTVTELVPGPRVERTETEAEAHVRDGAGEVRHRHHPARNPWTWTQLAEALDRGCGPGDYAELRSIRPAERPSPWLRIRVGLWVFVLAVASVAMLSLSVRELQSVAVIVAMTSLFLLFSDATATTVPASRDRGLDHREIMWALAAIDLDEVRRHRDVHGLPPSLAWRLAGLPERFAPVTSAS